MVSFSCSYASCTRPMSWILWSRSWRLRGCRCMGVLRSVTTFLRCIELAISSLQAKYPGSLMWVHLAPPGAARMCRFSRQASRRNCPNVFSRKGKPLLLAQEAREGLPIDAQGLGCPGLVAAGVPEDALGVPAAELVQGGMIRYQRVRRGDQRRRCRDHRRPGRYGAVRAPPFADGLRQVLRQDGPAGVQGERARHRILQLADVPGPVPQEERLARVGGERGAPLAGVPRGEVLRQERNVLPPLAQRRNADGDDVEPVEEILPEPPRFDGLPEVLVGGGDHARVHLDGSALPHPADLAFLQDAQELSLDARADVADLVEKQGPAGGLLEQPAPGAGGAGEAAAGMAEQLTLEHAFGDRAAVHRDERTRRPGAGRVDGARDQLLAGPALAHHQNGGIGERDPRRGLVDLEHAFAAADHVRERVLLADLPLQAAVLGGQPAMPQRPVDHQLDRVHVVGLGDVVVGAAPDRIDGAVHVAEGAALTTTSPSPTT